MSTLTPEGRALVRELAERHGVGEEAVAHLLDAVVAGGGRMAQFSHPELGGAGQWMAGGMLMVGRMFDDALKARVGALCAELADAVGRPGATPLASAPHGPASGAWWPPELGSPAASGSQGATRYAYFPDARRLAVDAGGAVRVHDTLDHRIGGFSQRQDATAGIAMSSQHGAVDLATLPVVGPTAGPATASRTPETARTGTTRGRAGPEPDEPARDETSPSAPSRAPASPAPAAAPAAADAHRDDPLRLIERLGELRERGLLTDEEFADKKRELLARL